MYFLTTLAILSFTSSSSSILALATPTTTNQKNTQGLHHLQRQTPDPHIVDFRTYGAPGCFDENQGVYTYLQSDLDTCFQFSSLESAVESIFVVDINDGCSVYAYTDSACTEGEITVPVGIANCYNATSSLGSFQTVCS